NFEAAEENFRKFIELIPDSDQGYVNLGLLYGHMGEAAKAIPFFEKALALNPQNQKAKEFLQRMKEKGAPK
ncbi:MAG: tetratricopeptide repeat protein, partial [Deltaproteobacteria bacterium]|nr:tetratricopeptide repeat protein [Deltaproteobacteria bacterium]